MHTDLEEPGGHKVVIDSDVRAPRIYLGTKGKPTVVFYRLDNEGVDVPAYPTLDGLVDGQWVMI